ncbi:MAG TPA: PTS sugar transporter subunit IIA [Caulobacteraceae bacterium]|nr:PTS sugar transporter subunit IIA [Caulobacteraceae bacterium]
MNLESLLEGGCIAPRVSASDKRQVFTILSEIAARTFSLDKRRILEALVEREAEGSTGVGHGVAAPHAIVPGLDRMRGIFLRLETPVDFNAVDDQPVDLVFALFSPPGGASDHLRALSRILRLLRQVDLREQLRRARAPAAIRTLLVQEARPTAA